MTDVKTILVGTIGQGIMRSADGGESWRRVGIDAGMHSDALVRTLGNHPGQARRWYSPGPTRECTAATTAARSGGLLDTADERHLRLGHGHRLI